MLSVTVVLVLQMVKYFERYDDIKFDDEICLCCVCPCWYELMNMKVGLWMCVFR